MKVTSIRCADSAEWDLLWEQSESTTFYHSRHWYELHSFYKPECLTRAWTYEFSDGLRAILPVITQGDSEPACSSPQGTYGGWIGSQPLTREHGELIVADLKTRVPDLVWTANPFDSVAVTTAESGRPQVTHALRLTGGFEETYRRGSKGHTSAEKKARRAGVTARRAEGLQDWLTYYDIYEDSLRRWGDAASSRYDRRLFERMAEMDGVGVSLWLAEFEGAAVAGALCLYSKRHVGYWHGAALESHFHLRPVQLLIYDVVRDACESGHHWFDFNPSGGHEGVQKFKEHFGCEALSCPILYWESFRTRATRRLRSFL